MISNYFLDFLVDFAEKNRRNLEWTAYSNTLKRQQVFYLVLLTMTPKKNLTKTSYLQEK